MTDEEPKRIEGATYVCTVPAEIGAVTKLEVKGGRVIARTESGHTMIVPQLADDAEGSRQRCAECDCGDGECNWIAAHHEQQSNGSHK